jgi:hypothetical protein
MQTFQNLDPLWAFTDTSSTHANHTSHTPRTHTHTHTHASVKHYIACKNTHQGHTKHTHRQQQTHTNLKIRHDMHKTRLLLLPKRPWACYHRGNHCNSNILGRTKISANYRFAGIVYNIQHSSERCGDNQNVLVRIPKRSWQSKWVILQFHHLNLLDQNSTSAHTPRKYQTFTELSTDVDTMSKY